MKVFTSPQLGARLSGALLVAGLLVPGPVLAAGGEPAVGELEAVAVEAVAAWEAFASSGRLADVEGAFDPDGPQWAVFVEEAGPDRSLVVPQFDVTEVTVRQGADLVVWVAVSLRGPGGVVEVGWDLELVPDGDGFRVWTVHTATSRPAGPPEAGGGVVETASLVAPHAAEGGGGGLATSLLLVAVIAVAAVLGGLGLWLPRREGRTHA